MDNKPPIWRDILGYEGLYQVSNYGQVKSLERKVSNGKGLRNEKSRILSPTSAREHLIVRLSANGKQKAHYIHRLTAATFISEIPRGMVVNHLDYNPLNNHVDNLEITTPAKNTQHSVQFRKDNGIKFNKKRNRRPDINLGLTVDELNNEQWVDINGYKDLYQISNLGRVKSLPRVVKRGKGTQTVKERILKNNLDDVGYLQVILSKNGKKKTHRIHQLVAEHFLGERPSLDHVINHIDHNKLNNRLNNLEYVTYQENTIKYYEFSQLKQQ